MSDGIWEEEVCVILDFWPKVYVEILFKMSGHLELWSLKSIGPCWYQQRHVSKKNHSENPVFFPCLNFQRL